ncbi:uncharacterized protein LOC129963886 isoform X3 [Argiope bruennichi]|uniref:uncharacterized protein LOC129963886 isoform X3 n=1 Tax=Argiope bruennichi TaxID=94029 RepID=UPI0024958733|nr:uncharacterized protein LOC129963886 isoform X3 [Argiope bruennichi]
MARGFYNVSLSSAMPFQIVLGIRNGNCTDPNLRRQLDDYCYSCTNGNPIQFATCIQTNFPNGGYSYKYNCYYVHECPKADQSCQNYCRFYGYPYSCTIPSKRVYCACGKISYDNKLYYYYLY